MLGLGGLAKAFFGSANERRIKKWRGAVQVINDLELQYADMDADVLRGCTDVLRDRISSGASLDDVLPDAFAIVREASKRVLGMRHFDVQLIGGIALHSGMVVEMRTGEGKTLVATLPVYLNALLREGVHVVTVNDYLARRDAEWMRPVYEFLGLSMGVIAGSTSDSERKHAYEADVTYATNNELGFDYLRDNLKYSLSSMVQKRGHKYAIVDEVDSVLIDEARTPLIISGPAEDRSGLYHEIDAIVQNLKSSDYDINEQRKAVTLTEEGIGKAEALMREADVMEKHESLYDPNQVVNLHHLTQAMRAHKMYACDKDYVVQDGRVIIVDEFTGRMMPGRRFSDGLHQALEAKEEQKIQPENATLASVTFQNYFRMYNKLSGMTGTAMTEAAEFAEIYSLDVVSIPTNKKICCKDSNDLIYRTEEEKIEAVIEAVKEGNSRNQPILIGTVSIEKSEKLSAELKRNGIKHNVLNALYHEREAHTIAQAGLPGAVTLATNMAGRGTDIRLGGSSDESADGEMEDPKKHLSDWEKESGDSLEDRRNLAIEAGGLWVIGTERYEGRRIDNQLRGRKGRQGDPGRSTFFLSLEDDLMRIFGSERIEKILHGMGFDRGEAIEHPWISKAVEKAQMRIEAHNFDIRRNLLKYDDVANQQRQAIFEQRLEIIRGDNIDNAIMGMYQDIVAQLFDQNCPSGSYTSQWKIEELEKSIREILSDDTIPVAEWASEDGIDKEILLEKVINYADDLFGKRVGRVDITILRQIKKAVFLQQIGKLWSEHLSSLESLRQIVGLRGYGQKDPLNEYKSESFSLFENLLYKLRYAVVEKVAKIKFLPEGLLQLPEDFDMTILINVLEDLDEVEREYVLKVFGIKQFEDDQNRDGNRSKYDGVRRNQLCPCESGKKFKNCHGRI
jgi:preprotein translocase subunit SecA